MNLLNKRKILKSLPAGVLVERENPSLQKEREKQEIALFLKRDTNHEDYVSVFIKGKIYKWHLLNTKFFIG